MPGPLLNRVNQENIVAGGNVVAGDLVHINIGSERRTNLREACERLQQGIKQNPDKLQFIEKLAEFMADTGSGTGGRLRSLEEKLSDGGLKAKSSRAIRLKERFRKKLEAASFNQLIQEVYALIFVEIDAAFEYRVRPHINAGNALLANREMYSIFESIEAQIHGTTDVTKEDLEGMLYFLAGNCFIDWDRQ